MMKINKNQFDMDDELPLSKTREIYSMKIDVKDAFLENNKCYPQVFLDECQYEL